MKNKDSASRVKYLRTLTGLSRSKIEDKYGLSSATLRSWEEPSSNRNGITEKGAIQYAEVLKQEGINISYEWIYRGIGKGPITYTDPESKIYDHYISHAFIPEVDWEEDEAIFAEAEYFKTVNKNAVTIRVMDDGMKPFYSLGDWVGGIWQEDQAIRSCTGLKCIIEKENNQLIVRRLERGDNDKYNLFCINPNTTVQNVAEQNITVVRAAPVIWHRCLSLSLF